jgi:hypothetical protein
MLTVWLNEKAVRCTKFGKIQRIFGLFFAAFKMVIFISYTFLCQSSYHDMLCRTVIFCAVSMLCFVEMLHNLQLPRYAL